MKPDPTKFRSHRRVVLRRDMCLATAAAAADAVIHGVVTDNAGKPIRGAIVKATAGGVSISRYSQNDGRYEITVPSGSYDVSVDAYGFGPKKQTKDAAQAVEANFSLSPRIDVSRLSAADIDSLLPDNPQTRLIRSSCISCHNFDTILRRRGATSAEWQGLSSCDDRRQKDVPAHV